MIWADFELDGRAYNLPNLADTVIADASANASVVVEAITTGDPELGLTGATYSVDGGEPTDLLNP
jgi:hypothetical protein